MDTRRVDGEYNQIMNELIESEPDLAYIKNSNVRILALSSEHEKKSKYKTVYGQCEKVQEKYKWAIPSDFTITVFEPNVVDFTEEQIRILLFHELLHVGVEQNDGSESYSIIPHDLEDFKIIIDRFGTSWSEV